MSCEKSQDSNWISIVATLAVMCGFLVMVHVFGNFADGERQPGDNVCRVCCKHGCHNVDDLLHLWLVGDDLATAFELYFPDFQQHYH